MNWVFLAGIIIILLFSFVILYGAPFLPTLASKKTTALELLDLQPGELLLELGSGDGRMLLLAAKRGIHAIGYELNPLLVLYSRVVTFRYRKLVTVRLANFWNVPLPACNGIYVFLLEPYMSKLHKKITQEITNPVKVVSFAFEIPKLQPAREKGGMYLYVYKNTTTEQIG